MSTKTKPKAKPVAKTKNPVYKQWWFWVIIVVVLLIIGAIGSGNKTENGGSDKSNQSQQTNPETTSEQDDEAQDTESGNETYRVGDTVALKNQTVSVTSIQRNYSTGNPYVTPKDGKEYVKVDISVANTSNAKRYFSAADWKMQDGDGVIDAYNFTATAMLDNAFGSPIELASGGRASGSLVFEIPKGDTNLELQYKASLLKTIIIKL